MKQVLLTILIVVIVVVAAVASYVKLALPDVGPAPDLHIAITPERVQHGEYDHAMDYVCRNGHFRFAVNIFLFADNKTNQP